MVENVLNKILNAIENSKNGEKVSDFSNEPNIKQRLRESNKNLNQICSNSLIPTEADQISSTLSNNSMCFTPAKKRVSETLIFNNCLMDLSEKSNKVETNTPPLDMSTPIKVSRYFLINFKTYLRAYNFCKPKNRNIFIFLE